MIRNPKHAGLELGMVENTVETLRRDLFALGNDPWTVETARNTVERIRAIEELLNDIKRKVDDAKRAKMKEKS